MPGFSRLLIVLVLGLVVAASAQALRPRKRPPISVMPRDEKLAAKGLALCSVADIYHGMENVERGEVKWIRIMEQLPRPWAARRRWQPACGHTQPPGGGVR